MKNRGGKGPIIYYVPWGGGFQKSLVYQNGMSKDMEKKVTTTVLYKDENFL